jgi:glycerol-3-phosphate cytidylyltransferase
MIIGYTSGVFDLFHIGHLKILKKAKERCDKLIVGVTTDSLAYELKGKLPLVPFEERIDIVSAIKYVDLAVEEYKDDKFLYYSNYGYSIIFKGDDWKGSSKWEKIEFEANKKGIKVHFLPYTMETSSSKRLVEIKNFYLSDE